MNTEIAKWFLWSAAINYTLQITWCLLALFARDSFYRFAGKGIILLNLVPYLALRLSAS